MQLCKHRADRMPGATWLGADQRAAFSLLTSALAGLGLMSNCQCCLPCRSAWAVCYWNAYRHPFTPGLNSAEIACCFPDMRFAFVSQFFGDNFYLYGYAEEDASSPRDKAECCAVANLIQAGVESRESSRESPVLAQSSSVQLGNL